MNFDGGAQAWIFCFGDICRPPSDMRVDDTILIFKSVKQGGQRVCVSPYVGSILQQGM